MKTATIPILTFSIWLGMLTGNLLLAQPGNINKRSSVISSTKTVYVAQQSSAANPAIDNTTSSQPAASSMPSSASSQPSDSAEGAVYADALSADQNPQVMPEDMIGVENGLWEGCTSDNCCAVCGGGYCAPPTWYTEQGARILARSRPRRTGLGIIFVQGTNPLTGQVQIVPDDLLTTKTINYDAAVGYNAAIGRYLGRDSMDRDDFLEFAYWGMNTWVDSALVQGTAQPIRPCSTAPSPLAPCKVLFLPKRIHSARNQHCKWIRRGRF